MAVDVLQAKIRKLKNPTMVCICPTIRELPLHIKKEARHKYGQTLRAAADAYRTFSFGILDALKETVPAVSIVSGAFSALGADGVAAMQEVLAYAQSLGYYVLLDLMRADLGTTAQDQADACFGAIQVGEASFTPYPCDGVLMSGFLGSDAVKPFVDYCRTGKNVFIISRSSNKSAREVQDLLSGDRVVYQVMADLAMRWSTGLFGANGYSEIGIAVGATNRQVLETLRRKYDRLFFLVPGYGAQGAKGTDIAGCFDQTAGLIFFLDDLDVRIDVGNRRDGFRNAGNVYFGIICALEHTVLSQRVHQSDNVHRFAFAEQAAHFLIDGPVLLRIEHIGVHLGDQAVQDGFIHQRCAKHALFRLHVIRQLNAQAGQA